MRCLVFTLCLFASCNRPQPEPQPNPSPDGTTVEQLLVAHSQQRAAHGVAALVMSDKLMIAAGKHASWMAGKRKLSHTGSNGSSFVERAEAEGYKFWTGGENIAAGQRSVEEVMGGWMNSSGHRANILNGSYTEVGFGVVDNYWCVVFGAPQRIGQAAVFESQPDGLQKD